MNGFGVYGTVCLRGFGFKWVWGTLVLCCLGLFSSGLVFVEVLPGLFRKNHIGAAVVSRL